MSLASILKKATIAAAGLAGIFAADGAYAQTTWNTRGLTHEQIKELMDGDGERDASPGDTIKFNVTSYTMPFRYDPFIVGIDSLIITGNGDTMDSTVIQNHPDVGYSNGLAFNFRATNCTIKNMTIENIQFGIKAGELPQGKIMHLSINNVLIRDIQRDAVFSSSAQDGDGDKNRQGQENVLLTNSVVRDSNIALHSENEERNEQARYGVLSSNTLINCNQGVLNTWHCEDGDYPCDCPEIYVPGVGRDDGNTFNGQKEGQSFTNEFRCGNGRGAMPGDDTADNTIEFLVTNPTLYDEGIGTGNIEADPQESFWGHVAHRGSPRIGQDGKTVTRGGRKNYYGDYDRDGDVDMKDIQMFQNYFSGNSKYTIDDRAKITSIDWNGEDNVNGKVGVRINLADYTNIVPAITGPEFND